MLFQWINSFHKDYEYASQGGQTRYAGARRADHPNESHRARSGRAPFVNDGRAPDTTRTLLNGTIASPRRLTVAQTSATDTPTLHISTNRSIQGTPNKRLLTPRRGRPAGASNWISTSCLGLDYAGFAYDDNSCYFDSTSELLYAFYCSGGQRLLEQMTTSVMGSVVGLGLLVRIFSQRRHNRATGNQQQQQDDAKWRNEVLEHVRDANPRAARRGEFNHPWDWFESLFGDADDRKALVCPTVSEKITCSVCGHMTSTLFVQRGPIAVPEGLSESSSLCRYLNGEGFITQRTGKTVCNNCKALGSCTHHRALSILPEMLVLERNGCIGVGTHPWNEGEMAVKDVDVVGAVQAEKRDPAIFFPTEIVVQNETFHLFGHVVSKGGRGKHYTTIFRTKDGYYEYDDMRSGNNCHLVSNTRVPKEFAGALRNTVLTLYVHDSDLSIGKFERMFTDSPFQQTYRSSLANPSNDEDSDLQAYLPVSAQGDSARRTLLCELDLATRDVGNGNGATDTPNTGVGLEATGAADAMQIGDGCISDCAGQNGVETLAGLPNVGNTCFVTVAIRLLLAVPGLAAAVIAQDTQIVKAITCEERCVRGLAAVFRLMSDVAAEQRPPESLPRPLLNTELIPHLADCLGIDRNSFKLPLAQEDAGECWMRMIVRLEACAQALRYGPLDNFFTTNVYGSLYTVTQCGCKQQTHQVSNSMGYVSISIDHCRRKATLEQLIADYLAPNELAPSDRWRCPNSPLCNLPSTTHFDLVGLRKRRRCTSLKWWLATLVYL
eukprot:Opistho-2@92118